MMTLAEYDAAEKELAELWKQMTESGLLHQQKQNALHSQADLLPIIDDKSGQRQWTIRRGWLLDPPLGCFASLREAVAAMEARIKNQ